MQSLPDSLAEYPVHASDKIRYCDLDPQGHVNNALFSTFLETGRTEILYAGQERLADDDCAFVIARLEMDFVSELHWPGTVEIGTVLLKTGSSSMTLGQSVFQNGAVAARAWTVIVQMDQTTRKSRPLSERAREKLARLMRVGADA